MIGSVCAMNWSNKLDLQIKSSIFTHPASMSNMQLEEGSGASEDNSEFLSSTVNPQTTQIPL